MLSLLLFNLLFRISYKFNSYDYSNYFREDDRLRTKFLNKKRQNEKIELFDRINSNKTVFVDDILHMQSNATKVSEIEESFRNMLAMKGVTYIFKRDFFWRTWRQVWHGNLTVVCYRCQNSRDITKEMCQNCGYWVIEEKPPPCSYEMFSLNTEWEICVANYNQYPDSYGVCPSTINRLDLKSACDNPIKTKLQITKNYSDVSGRNSVSVICQGRENCEISTIYTILPDSIVFRIVNSTNNIFYSRVMKTGNKNYVCIDDCGKIDPETNLISKNEQPYRLDLFKKNKREDILSMTVLPIKKQKSFKNKKDLTLNYIASIKKKNSNKYQGNPLEHYMELENNLIKPEKNELKQRLFKIKNSVTKSTCMKLQEKYRDIEEENTDY